MQDGKTPSEIATEYEHEDAAKLISQGPPPKGAGKAATTMPGSHAQACVLLMLQPSRWGIKQSSTNMPF